MTNLTLIKSLGKSTGKENGFGSDGKKTRKGGDAEALIRRIHEAAGTPRTDAADSVSDDNKAIDVPPVKAVESTDPTLDPEPAPAATETTPEPVVFNGVSRSLIDGLILQGVERAKAEEREKQAELAAQLDKAAAELEAKEKAIAAEKQKNADLITFQQHYGLAGSLPGDVERHPGQRSAPKQIIVRDGGQISGLDALAEYQRVKESMPRRTAKDASGYTVEHVDTRQSDGWLKKNREAVLAGLQQKLQQTDTASGGKEAVTARTDILPMFTSIVADFTRLTQHPNHIWGAIPDMNFQMGRDAGDGISVLRYAYAEGSTTAADWLLTNVASLTTDAQPIQASAVKITIEEQGMGKPGLAANVNKPIGINLFLNATSVQDVMNVVSANLGLNYAQWETASVLYGLMNSTGVTYYNKKGEPTVTPGSLAAGDSGQCNWDFLTGLSAEMSTQGVPAYANGKYLLALAPKDLATLEMSLRANMQFLNRASIADMTSVFLQSSNNSDMNYSGYKGDIGDFMVFDSSTLAAGPFAAALAANTETIAGSARAMRTGFALGAHSMARAVAQPFNIRESDMTDYQRQKFVVWNSYENFGALDLSASLSPAGTLVPQQTRVFKLRFTGTAI
jgi:hypothetical protein